MFAAQNLGGHVFARALLLFCLTISSQGHAAHEHVVAEAISSVSHAGLTLSLTDLRDAFELPEIGMANQRGVYESPLGSHAVLNFDPKDNRFGIRTFHVEWNTAVVNFDNPDPSRLLSVLIWFKVGTCPSSGDLEEALGVSPRRKFGMYTDGGPTEPYERFMLRLTTGARVSVRLAPTDPCYVELRRYAPNEPDDDWDRRFDHEGRLL